MKIRKVGKVKIGKDSTKGYVYPKLRLPKDFSNLIGVKVNIYEAFLEEGRGILIVPEEIGQIGQNNLDNLEIVGRKDNIEERIFRMEKAIEKLTELIAGNKLIKKANEHIGVGSAGFEPATFASSRLDQEVKIKYLQSRFSKLKSDKSKKWIRRVIESLFEKTEGIITVETIMDFQNWYRSTYGYEAQCKFHDNTKNFLGWLYKLTGDERYKNLQEILERPKRDSKKLNPILLREEDIRNLIKAVWKSNFTEYSKVKLTSAILLGAYTGLRPEATIGKLTKEDIEKALERDPPLLWIPEEKDKERFPHWVPLHPVVVEWLRKALEYNEKEVVFYYDKIRKDLDSLNVKAIHTGRKITYSHLRKFFEQMCNNVLKVHPGLRDYIMAHNTGSLDVQSYDGKLPIEIYEQYMEAWGEVDLLPKIEVIRRE